MRSSLARLVILELALAAAEQASGSQRRDDRRARTGERRRMPGGCRLGLAEVV